MPAMSAIETSAGTIGLLHHAPETPRGLPILFLHGVGSDKSVWAPQLDHFGQYRRALAADYPGYGDSAPADHATRDDYARAMIALLDTCEIGKAHVCGLSLGGVVAIAMAALAPERIASLVLADSFALHPDGQGIHDRSVEASARMGMRALAEARVDMLLGASPPAGLREEVIATMARIPQHSYEQGARAVWLADQRERARHIDLPTLVLCGDEDQVTPPALSEELAKLVKGAQTRLVKGAGHLANAERPDAFNQMVEEHLRAVE
ncbi:alpha/beta fold hydrolase [Sphingomicrobium lutaoense]|uniref:3-oxoadipate enol-lactonase n=1 Tax=Sphingomicrobium lutaoense TaxID=515949 RepID=A0A839YUV2_9SPHN|nr:alpha/beta fold hydrolase [Sphingomicrobium lutaoense]MBB3763009.1 3-oxoadipate enol-lactonase [Sphingomicrobium lutaoense]